MKKVLFATTALVMTAGVAAAEVSLSGDGRMGVMYDGNDFQFTSRARVTFTLSGETDGGLSFGGSFRVDHEDEDGLSASAGGAGSVYISGAFGKITMGDIDSGAESAVGDLPGVGLTGLGDLNEFAYPGSGLEANGNPGLLYSYAFDNGNVYLSAYDGTHDINGDGVIASTAAVAAGAGDSVTAYSVGGNYTFGNFTVAAGYESYDYDNTALTNGETLVIAAIASFGDVKVTAAYANSSDLMLDTTGNGIIDGTYDVEQYGIGAEATFDATTVSAFYRTVDIATVGSVDAYGIGASYDLGGGASIKGGIVDNGSNTVGDFGIAFKF